MFAKQLEKSLAKNKIRATNLAILSGATAMAMHMIEKALSATRKSKHG